MRLVRFLILAAILLAASSLVWGSTDPQMILDPLVPGAFGYCTDPVSLTPVLAQGATLPFSWSINGSQTFYCFQNLDTTNTIWPDLTITLPSLTFQMSDVSCGTDAHFYSSCTVIPDPSNSLFAAAFFWSGSPPIGYGAAFGFDVRPPGGGTCPGDGCFPDGTTFTVTSSVAVPEPATMILVGSGVAALIDRRRRSKKA